MKEGKTFMKRSLALILSAVLLLSNLSGLSMLVDAADESQEMSVTVGQIVADNYNLTDAEKAILASGYLVSGTVKYEVPGNNDGLVSVDTDNAKITATSKDGWTPVSAVIKYGSNELEVALTNGVGTYDADVVGNAFSVEVKYQLHTTVDKAVQEQLLNAPAYLKQGVANLTAVSGQGGNLYILEQAMPELINLRDTGVETSFTTISLSDECKNAITALNNQMANNGGKLNLSTMIEALDAGTKTGYMMSNGIAMQAEVANLVEKVSKISTALNTIYENIEWLIENGFVDATLANQVKTLSGVCSNLADGLAAVNADPWTAATLGTDLVYADADYTKLDALVADLSTTSNVTVKEALLVAETTLQANLSMWNVTVNVILETVQENNEVKQYGETHTVVLTLADGVSAEEVHAEINDSKVVENAIAAWGDAYVEGKFWDEWVNDVTGNLTADTTIYILYHPEQYTVTIDDKSAEYPYGYKLTLPKHSDSTMAYDYYDEDKNYVPQGSVITVDKDMTFTREEGAAYVTGNLLSIIADNVGDSKLTAILSSGALLIDETINYREPKDLSELVTLSGSKLTALTYASDYEGLFWTPYSYVVDGNENLFNGATEVTISGEFEKVEVYYRLTLSNYSAAEVQEILDLVNVLVEQAAGQQSVLNALASNVGEMSQLNKSMLGALNGMIDVADISDEMKAYFKPIVSDIINLCVDSDNNLKLYNMLNKYTDEQNGGLAYFYKNHVAFLKELDLLTGYLSDMVGDQEKIDALAVVMEAAGYGSYVEKLENINEDLNTLKEDLIAPNAVIDTESDNLRNLANALIAGVDLSNVTAQSPYLELGPVVKTADKYVSVEVKVVIGGKTHTIPAVTVLKGNALTDTQIAELKAAVAAIIKENLGDNASYYTNDYKNGSDLDALSGKTLTVGESYTYTWTANTYTVKIDGEADQTVTIENLTIKLPGHPNASAGMSYEYTIDGKTYTAGSYTFTAAQLDSLFVNGTLTITREEKNEAVEKLVTMVEDINKAMGYEALVLTQKNGIYTGITANLDASGIVDFVMGLVGSGYSYIGLNGDGLLYMNEENTTEVSIQTLIDAFLNDDAFGSNTLIALGQKGKGVLLNTTLQLGNSSTEIQYEDLAFTINVTSVPSQFVKAADALNKVKSYISFHTANGELVFDLNLPDAVYGAYLVALTGTGHVDKSNMNEVNNQIAFQFLYDYFELVTTSDMDAETFTNTIAMLGKDVDLTAYNTYYEYFCSFMNGGNQFGEGKVTVNEDDSSLDVTLNGKSVFDGLLKLIGKDTDAFKTYLGMLKEYKAGGTIDATARASLKNPSKSYNAMIVDLQASGVTNKYACTSSYSALANKVSKLAGYSAVMLLTDVSGDLTFSGTTILDLNGKVITGNVTTTGTLYIIDSSMGTKNCGGITKNVSGNVVILAGNYGTNDVSSFLKDGYYQEEGYVRNELYYIEADSEGNITFVLDTDVIDGNFPNVKALALDIAADLVLNYITAAALNVGGNDVYDVNMDDLLALLNSSSKVDDVINKLLNSICADENNIMGLSGVVNMILADLINFEDLHTALTNGTELATYELTTAPWHVALDHITDGNYMTVSIVSNPELAKKFTVSVKLDGSHTEYLENLVGELKDIVDASRTEILLDLYKPTYGDKEFDLIAGGEAIAVIDLSENEDYLTVIGVLLAYGNPDKAEAVAAALNNNDNDALKEIIDNTTVEEVFNSLKAVSRSVDFKAMAAKVGVTDYTDSTAALENVYHLLLCGAGKVLEELEIVGTSQKLGALYTVGGFHDGSDCYVLSFEDLFREGELNVRSYSALYELTAYELTLKVKLFAEEEEHVHRWSDWLIEDATCITEGLKYRYCLDNPEHIESETLPLDPNNHVVDGAEWKTIVEPTETTDGLAQLICPCGAVLEERVLPATGNGKTGDYGIVIISSIALAALMGLAVVEFGFKRRLLK